MRVIFPTPARGFTLIEMVVAVAVIALALSLVAIQAGASLKRAALRRVGHDLVAALRYTRGQAIASGDEQRLALDVEQQIYRAPKRPEVALPQGYRMTLVTAASEQTGATSGTIRFFPDGSSTGGRVRLISNAREWNVEVAWLTGEVRLREVTP